MKAYTVKWEVGMRLNEQRTRPGRPQVQHNPLAAPRIKRVLMPEIDVFTDRDDSVEVRQITRDFATSMRLNSRMIISGKRHC